MLIRKIAIVMNEYFKYSARIIITLQGVRIESRCVFLTIEYYVFDLRDILFV